MKIPLTLSVLGKLKDSIFEIPIIQQTLNINKWRTTNGKSNQPAYHWKPYQILFRKRNVETTSALIIF